MVLMKKEYTFGSYDVIGFLWTPTDYEWRVPLGIEEVDVLVVGAGGGGGNNVGGGAGAGGVVLKTNFAVAGLIPIKIGSGGIQNTDGENTIFSNITALGGGRGGTRFGNNGNNGGSGGGAGPTKNYGNGLQPSQSPPSDGFGNRGGTAFDSGANSSGGGGGGANGNGSNGASNNGGNGGSGKDYSSYFGTVLGINGIFGAGGKGGRFYGPAYTATQFNENTGNGGGGGGGERAWTVGFNGGSGIVIVRFIPISKVAYGVGANFLNVEDLVIY